MRDELPFPAVWLGLGGLIPFVGLAAAAVLDWPDAMPALAAYGATILAFLGAVHWGLALAVGKGGWRLVLGVVPALVAWVALLLPTEAGLVLLATGIGGTLAVENAVGEVPPGYLGLRRMLSAGACASLLIAAMLG